MKKILLIIFFYLLIPFLIVSYVGYIASGVYLLIALAVGGAVSKWQEVLKDEE